MVWTCGKKDLARHSRPGKRKMGRQIKDGRTEAEWAGLDVNSSQRAAEDRQRWQKIVADVSRKKVKVLFI